MYDPVITTFQQRVSTEADSRELSESKTDSTRAGSCRGTSTPACHGSADKAQCSSSTEHTSPFSKVVSKNAQVKHINIISSTSYNSNQHQQEWSPALWQGLGSLSSQEEPGNKKSHRETILCQNICSPILAHGTCYMQLMASSTRRWKT